MGGQIVRNFTTLMVALVTVLGSYKWYSFLNFWRGLAILTKNGKNSWTTLNFDITIVISRFDYICNHVKGEEYERAAKNIRS